MKVIQELEDANGVHYADTDITTEEWLQMLTDGTINKPQRDTLICFYREPVHKGICKELADKYGGSWQLYSSRIKEIGRKAQKRLNRFEVKGVDSDRAYWVIPMNGWGSKPNWVWQIKPELCEAIKQFLYQDLLNTYKDRRRYTGLEKDNELYKWELINDCIGKNDIDLAKFIVTDPQNLMSRWQKMYFYDMSKNNPQEFAETITSLFDEQKPLEARISEFKTHEGDERTLSVFLACRYPNKYMPYKNSYYKDFCEYLGIKLEKAGKKYLHYLKIMEPLEELIKHDEELQGMLAGDIGTLKSYDKLTAQDIAYICFDRAGDIYDWMPFYAELADKLRENKDKPDELATLIYGNFDREKEIKFLHDEDGSDFKEIDPFTVFSIINREMKGRMELVKKMKELFKIETALPTTFDGIPTQNHVNSAFCTFGKDRSTDGKDIERLWSLFDEALKDEPDIEESFNAVLKQHSIAIAKLTMGLFYIRPKDFLALDGNNRQYLEQYGIDTKNYQKMQYAGYAELLKQVKEQMANGKIKERSFPEFSAEAYKFDGQPNEGTNPVYYKEIVDLLRLEKNIIIQGAPGTGKTYELFRIISRLCFPDLTDESDDVLKDKLKKLKENRQVEYVTFHQSMDYEEFVEGIRPHTNDDGNITYETETGIFKQICERAKKPIVEENNLKIKGDASVWKVSLAGTGDNQVRTECMQNSHIRIGWDDWGEDFSQMQKSPILEAFYNKMTVGDIVFSCYSARTIDAIGVVIGDAEWNDDYPEYKRVRKVKWLLKGINEDIYEMNGQTLMTLGTVYRLNNITLDKVFEILNKYGVNRPTEARKNDNPYVLVIDEINRGNVSKIFGELITLLESDKREGKDNAIEVTLPYSKERFSVPDNLYIIGTMNTADRSLDTLDYAMRRRFGFVTFKPKELDVEGFNKDLFTRVSKLFIGNFDEYIANPNAIQIMPSDNLSEDIRPEDVWIGQSYFLMNNEEGNDVTSLRIRYEIIPILEEYVKDGVFKDSQKVYDVIQELKEYKGSDD